MTAWAFCLRLLYRVVRASVGTGQGYRPYIVTQPLQFIHCRRVEDRPFAVRTRNFVDNKVTPSSTRPVIARILYRFAQCRYPLPSNILNYRVIRQPIQHRSELGNKNSPGSAILETTLQHESSLRGPLIPIRSHSEVSSKCPAMIPWTIAANRSKGATSLKPTIPASSMVDPLPTGHCLQLYSVATLLDKKNCLRWNPPKGTVAVFFIVCAVESSGGSTSKGALNVFSRYVTYLRSASDFLCCSINSLIGLSWRTGI